MDLNTLAGLYGLNPLPQNDLAGMPIIQDVYNIAPPMMNPLMNLNPAPYFTFYNYHYGPAANLRVQDVWNPAPPPMNEYVQQLLNPYGLNFQLAYQPLAAAIAEPAEPVDPNVDLDDVLRVLSPASTPPRSPSRSPSPSPSGSAIGSPRMELSRSSSTASLASLSDDVEVIYERKVDLRLQVIQLKHALEKEKLERESEDRRHRWYKSDMEFQQRMSEITLGSSREKAERMERMWHDTQASLEMERERSRGTERAHREKVATLERLNNELIAERDARERREEIGNAVPEANPEVPINRKQAMVNQLIREGRLDVFLNDAGELIDVPVPEGGRAEPRKLCDICVREYKDEDGRIPRVLKCGHTLCEHCVEQISTTGFSVTCPYCRRVTRNNLDAENVLEYDPRHIEKNLPKNFALLE